MEETWKILDGFEDRYIISNHGRVKMLYTNNQYGRHYYSEGRLMTPVLRQDGYLRISLTKNNKRKSYYVHVLVAQTYIPNPNNLPQVNHINEDKTDNFVWVNEDGTVDLEKSNLEWCTPRQNCLHGTRIQRWRDSLESRGKRIYQLDSKGNIMAVFSDIFELRDTTDYNMERVRAVLNKYPYRDLHGFYHERKTTYGCGWVYEQDYLWE